MDGGWDVNKRQRALSILRKAPAGESSKKRQVLHVKSCTCFREVGTTARARPVNSKTTSALGGPSFDLQGYIFWDESTSRWSAACTAAYIVGYCGSLASL